MSSNDEKWNFFNSNTCAYFLKENILPELYKDLSIWNKEYKGTGDVVINLGKTKKYDGKKYNGLYIQIDVGCQSSDEISFPVVRGRLIYKNVISGGINDPLFIWKSYEELLEKIKSLKEQ